MAGPLDTEPGFEILSNYESELKLVRTNITQKLDQIPDLSGEGRKFAVKETERLLEESEELVCLKVGLR